MILVTGATGLVGAHLLYSLLQENKTVRATRRHSSDLESLRQVFSFYTEDVDTHMDQIEWIHGDITDIPALEEAFSNVTQVYHCAASITFDPKEYRTLKKTNIEGTANVVNLCLKHKVEKLCYVSTIAVLGKTLDKSPINEEDDWNPETTNNVYSITKYGAEMEVWRGIQEGLNAVIVNPGVILGEGYFYKSSGAITKRVAKGITYFTQGSTGFVDVKDVTRAMVDLMRSPITNERYILVGANLSFQKVLSTFSKSLGVPSPKKSIKKTTLLFLSRLDAMAYSLFGFKRKLLKSMVESLYTESSYSSSKIQSQLEFSFTPIETSIKRIASAYSSSKTGSTNSPVD